jgi:fumarylacetoacetase
MAISSEFDDHFGLSNIPFGIASVSTDGIQIPAQAATRISSHVLFLAALADAGHFTDIEYPLATIFKSSTLNNTFAALPKTVHNTVRKTLQELLRGVLEEEQLSRPPDHSVFPFNAVQMHLPVRIGDFTDFPISVEPHSPRR